MTQERDNPDQQIVEKLRGEVGQLEMLEKRIRELEKERVELLDSTSHLAEKLKELHQVKHEWEWFFENSTEMLCIASLNGYFQRVNPAFARNLGYSIDYMLSRPFIEFVHPDDVDLTLKEFDRLVSGNDCINFENRYRDSEGKWHWFSWHCPAITPSITKLYAIARDITARKQYDAEILYKALHDKLTDLFNRAAFEERLINAIPRIKRVSGSEMALYLLDLDGFKEINDTYGHPAGDAVLKQLAKRFKQIQRDGEFICRYGGDEFAFIIDGAGPIDPEPLAKRIMEAASQPIELDKTTVTIGCSIGIAKFPMTASDADDLISQADTALYSVKKSGQIGYKIFNKVTMNAIDRGSSGAMAID